MFIGTARHRGLWEECTFRAFFRRAQDRIPSPITKREKPAREKSKLETKTEKEGAPAKDQ